LGSNGFVLREQGNGFIVSDQEGRMVKASSIARDLSRAQLVKRLGPFEPDGKQRVQAARAVHAIRTYGPRPVSIGEGQGGSEELYQRYQAEQSRNRQARIDIRHALRQQKQDQLSQAKEKARARRGLIRRFDCDSLSRRVLYHQASSSLRENVQSIHAQHREQRELRLDPVKPLVWFDWLAARAAMNDREAVAALRRRKHRAQRKANCLLESLQQGRGEAGTEEAGFEGASEMFPGLKIDGVTRQGTIIYANGESAIRDSGNRLEVSEGIKQDGLEMALAMAIKRFGCKIAIEGDAAFRDRVLHTASALKLNIDFTDRTRQAEARLLPDGIKERERADIDPVKQARSACHAGTASSDSGNPGEKAARRYIAERELKRQQIAGIPKHVLGEAGLLAQIRYAGWRRVDGQFLLLAKTSQDEIAVMPMDAAMIARLSRMKLDAKITLDDNQAVQSEGLRR
jgi:hypothetical protein